MNLRATSLMIVAAALLAGGSQAQNQSAPASPQLDKALAGRTPGAPIDCITHRAKMQIVDDSTILFRDRGIVYVQHPRGGCHGLSNGMSLIRDQFATPRMCAGDINQIIDVRTGFGTGACVYSEFVPYRKSG